MQGDFTRLTFRPKEHYDRVLHQQGRVLLDADHNENMDIQRHLDRLQIHDTVGPSGVPAKSKGFLLEKDGDRLKINPGRMWVDGLLCEWDNAYGTHYDDQKKWLPGAPPISGLANGKHLVYLDVWHRHVSSVDQPELREKALGGPDTTTRLQTVMQVRIRAAVTDSLKCGDCLTDADFVDDDTKPTTGLLTPVGIDVDTDRTPCGVPAGAKYRGQENRLYRVEVQQGGSLGTATFKWSRDNGSVSSRVEAQIADPADATKIRKLRVSRHGRDRVLLYGRGDLLEIVDDKSEFSGKPPKLLTVADVEESTGLITIADTPQSTLAKDAFKDNVRVRRWDGIVTPAANQADQPLKLELGIAIQLAAGHYRTGDWWAIAARAEGGWLDEFKDDIERKKPHGVKHHHARLGILEKTAGTFTLTDCRPRFVPLTQLSASCTSVTVSPQGACTPGEYTDVQAAINSLEGPGKVLILPGEYTVGTLTIPYDDVEICGCGPTRSILKSTGTVIEIDGRKNTRIAGLGIETSGSAAAILLKATTRPTTGTTIEGCHVRGGPEASPPAVPAPPTAPAIRVLPSPHAIIDFAVLDNVLRGTVALSVRGADLRIGRNRAKGALWVRGGSNDVLVHDNRVDESGGAGIRVGGVDGDAADASVSRVAIVHNAVQNATASAIHVGAPGAAAGLGATDLLVAGNRVRASGAADAAGVVSTAPAIAIHGVKGLRVRENDLSATTGTATAKARAISLLGVERAEVASNQVVATLAATDARLPAIIAGGSWLRIADNHLEGSGILLRGDTADALVQGNQLRAVRGDGIVLGDDANLSLHRVDVSGNQVRDADGPGVRGDMVNSLVDLIVSGNHLTQCCRLSVYGADSGAIKLSFAQRSRVQGNHVVLEKLGASNEAHGIRLHDAADLDMLDNHVSAPDATVFRTGTALVLHGDRILAQGNRLIGGAIHVRPGCMGVSVRGNHVQGAKSSGIRVGEGGAGMTNPGGTADVTVEGNVVTGSGGSAASEDHTGGIVARNVTGLRVAGNRVVDPQGAGGALGVAALTCDKSVLDDNDVSGPGAAWAEGAALVTQGHNVRVSRNRLHHGGIWVRGGSEGVEVEANEVLDAHVDGIRLGGGFMGETGVGVASVVAVRGNRVSAAAHAGILADDPTGVDTITIQDNVVTSCKPGGGGLAAVHLVGVPRARVLGNRLWTGRADTSALVATRCDQLEVAGNEMGSEGALDGALVSLTSIDATVTDNALQGGGIWIRDGSRRVVVGENVLRAPAGIAIRLCGQQDGADDGLVEDVTVRDNEIVDAGSHGVVVGGEDLKQGASPGALRVHVEGNAIRGWGAAGDGAIRAAILLTGAERSRAASNRIEESEANAGMKGLVGILATWSPDVVIQDNHVRCPKGGVSGVTARGEGARILGNEISGAGLWLRSGSSRATLHGNRVRGARANGILLGGILDEDEPHLETLPDAAEVDVTENVVEEVRLWGIRNAATQEGRSSGRAERITLAANRLAGCALKAVDGDVGGIMLSGVDIFVVRDNALSSLGNPKQGLSGMGIHISGCRHGQVRANDVEGPVFMEVALSVRGSDLILANNRIRDGGLWIRDGSARVSVRGNDVNGGHFGVALCGLDWTEENAQLETREIVGVEILDNRIRAASHAGIGTFDRPQRAMESAVRDLRILGNRVEDCGEGGTGGVCEAPGGVVLTNVDRVVLRDNHVRTSLVDAKEGGCGVYVRGCGVLEVSTNHVLCDGHGENVPGPRWVAGIVALDLSAPRLGGALAQFEGNDVSCGAGHALLVVAQGHIVASGNTLVSRGVLEIPLKFDDEVAAQCVLLVSEGKSIDLTEPGTPEGRVRFHDNTVTYTAVENGLDVPPRAVGILTRDDASVQGNQVALEVDEKVTWVQESVRVDGTTVRVHGNRITERARFVQLSLYAMGRRAVSVVDNQTTSCIEAHTESMPPLWTRRDNHVLNGQQCAQHDGSDYKRDQ